MRVMCWLVFLNGVWLGAVWCGGSLLVIGVAMMTSLILKNINKQYIIFPRNIN